MNRQDIIGMIAKVYGVAWTNEAQLKDLEKFAALVASAERDKHKWDIHSCSPTCNRYACVATREAVLAEREACAQFIEHEYVRQFERPWRVDLSAAIRARGQA